MIDKDLFKQKSLPEAATDKKGDKHFRKRNDWH